MSVPDDLWIGQIAIERGLLTEDRLKEMLHELGLPDPPAAGLGDLLVLREVITAAELAEMVRERRGREAAGGAAEDEAVAPGMAGATSPFEYLLGQWLVRHEHATEGQIQECLVGQREAVEAGRTPPRLGELLVEKGYVPREVVLRALSQQKKTLLKCPDCRRQFNVVGFDETKTYTCRTCGGTLKKSDGTQRLSAEATDRIPVVRKPPTRSQAAVRTARPASTARAARTRAAVASAPESDPRLLYGVIAGGAAVLGVLAWLLLGGSPPPATPPADPPRTAARPPPVPPPAPPPPAASPVPSVEAIFDRAEARLRKGDREGARSDFEAFLKAAPRHPSAAVAESRLYGMLAPERTTVRVLRSAD